MEKFRKTPPPVGEAPIVQSGESAAESMVTAEDITEAENVLMVHLETYKNISEQWSDRKDQISDKWDSIVERHREDYEEAVKNINAITLAAGGISLFASVNGLAYALGSTGADSHQGVVVGASAFLLANAIGVLGLASRGIAEGVKKINEWRDERGVDKEDVRNDKKYDAENVVFDSKSEKLSGELNDLKYHSN